MEEDFEQKRQNKKEKQKKKKEKEFTEKFINMTLPFYSQYLEDVGGVQIPPGTSLYPRD